MNRLSLSRLACTIAVAIAVPASAASLFSRAEGSLSAQLASAERRAAVTIDRAVLARAQPGTELQLELPGVGAYRFKIDRRASGAEVTLLEGHLAGSPAHRLTLGVRKEGVTGFIATPSATFSLGYVNDTQWLGLAGADWRGHGDHGDDSNPGRPDILTPRAAAPGEQPPLRGAQPIDIDLSELSELREGDEAILRLPDLGALRVAYDETRPNANSATWVGHLKDFGTDFRVLLTYSAAGTNGYIFTPQGELEIVSGTGGGMYLIDPRKLGLKYADQHASCAAPPPTVSAADAPSAAKANAMPTTAAQPVASIAPAAAADGSTVIDVLVYFSPGFVQAYGGLAQAQARIDFLVGLSNQAYRDSGMAMQLRKVAAEQVGVSDSASNVTLLDQMRRGSGPFAQLAARRNAVGADLVTVVRPFLSSAHGGCGVGYIGGYGGRPIAGYGQYALSVVSDGNDRGGSNYYCQVITFPHELGHNMGAMHDRATVASQGGGQGATPYAYGYGRAGQFGTVMSYVQPRAAKFSNPDNYTCGGSQRCGIPDTDAANAADNAKALNLTRAAVANFRSLQVIPQVSLSGTVRINGRRKAGVAISGAPCTTSGSNGVFVCTVPQGFSGELRPSYARNGTTATFSPAARTYSGVASGAVNQNFAGTF